VGEQGLSVVFAADDCGVGIALVEHGFESKLREVGQEFAGVRAFAWSSAARGCNGFGVGFGVELGVGFSVGIVLVQSVALLGSFALGSS
jgi:hypothetical protein